MNRPGSQRGQRHEGIEQAEVIDHIENHFFAHKIDKNSSGRLPPLIRCEWWQVPAMEQNLIRARGIPQSDEDPAGSVDFNWLSAFAFQREFVIPLPRRSGMLELPVFERRGRTHDFFGCLAQVGVEVGGNGELPEPRLSRPHFQQQTGMDGQQMVAQFLQQQRIIRAGQKSGGDAEETTPKLVDLLALFRPLSFDFLRGSKTNHHSSFLNGVNRSEIEPPVGCLESEVSCPCFGDYLALPTGAAERLVYGHHKVVGYGELHLRRLSRLFLNRGHRLWVPPRASMACNIGFDGDTVRQTLADGTFITMYREGNPVLTALRDETTPHYPTQ